MSKDRLIAFTDAVLAIIMTILVLELDLPDRPTLTGLLEISSQFIAYIVSFFWLSVMWVNLHNEWEGVERVSNVMIWWNLFLLFISSLLPYATKFAATYFENWLAQTFYGGIVLLITFAFYGLGHATSKENPNRTARSHRVYHRVKMLDYGIKISSLFVGWLYPPIIMGVVIITAILVLMSIHRIILDKTIKQL